MCVCGVILNILAYKFHWKDKFMVLVFIKFEILAKRALFISGATLSMRPAPIPIEDPEWRQTPPPVSATSGTFRLRRGSRFTWRKECLAVMERYTSACPMRVSSNLEQRWTLDKLEYFSFQMSNLGSTFYLRSLTSYKCYSNWP